MTIPKRLVVTTEARFQRRADGSIWHDTGGRGYDFWTRYLDVFDEVIVVGRVFRETTRVAAAVEGPGVQVHALPAYTGLTGFVRQYRAIRRSIRKVCQDGASGFLARVPGRIGSIFVAEVQRTGHSYALEVVGDPYEALARGAARIPLRPIIREFCYRQLRRQCARAMACTYVTASALQFRYPVAAEAYSSGFSDVDLPNDAFVAQPRMYIEGPPITTKAISVGMLSAQKGHDLLIEAAAELSTTGVPVAVTLVGEGPQRTVINRRAADLGLDSVRLIGQLAAGQQVRQELDRADVFVLPSRGGEGLPRALLEAMARGLPCIATDLGGVAELLADEDIVPPRDRSALVTRLRQVATDPSRLAAMSARNLARARTYAESAMATERQDFLRAIVRPGSAGRTNDPLSERIPPRD